MTREEWLLWRKAGMGSSDAPAIMGASKWSTPVECLLEKADRTDGRLRAPWEIKVMNRGVRLEPEARLSYENWLSIKMPKKLVIHPRFPQLRASFDGLNRDEGRVLEIKCPGKEAHATALAGKIPEDYFWQCVHLLMVSGMEWLDYYSYDGENGVAVAMRRDLSAEKRLMEMELDFWKLVEKYRRQKTNVIKMSERR